MKRLTALLLVCGFAVFGLAACGSDDNNDSNSSATTGTTGASGASGASGTSGASGATGASGGGGGTLKVAADPSGQLKFTETSLSASAGKVKVNFTNDSSVPHNVTIEKGEDDIGKTKTVTGGSASTTVTLKPGKYNYYCSVDGHEQAGMKGTLTVK
jgi:plastocyanin